MFLKINELKSNHLGDAGLIGLECETGDFSDCELPESEDDIPIGCAGVFMFSSTNNSCGSKCETTRAKRNTEESDSEGSSKFSGWTTFYNNDDDPSGTGDHEHYSHYRNSKRDKLKVYGKDGTEFTSCKKIAIYVREIQTHARDFFFSTCQYSFYSKRICLVENPLKIHGGSWQIPTLYFFRILQIMRIRSINTTIKFIHLKERLSRPMGELILCVCVKRP